MKAFDILIIDADNSFTDIVKQELKHAGIGADTAHCKGEVFAKIEAKNAAEESFFLIVMDMHCKFITADEIKAVIRNLDMVMPHMLFSTNADKMLQKNTAGEPFRPKLLMERILKTLLTHPSMTA
jgi:DNA-binding response OmpR family regulator